MNVKEAIARYYGNEDALLQCMDMMDNRTRNKVCVIAIYCYRLCNGGIERVISEMIPIFQQMGYKVILITENLPCEDDYTVPDTVKRYTVISGEIASREKEVLAERMECLMDILKKEKVDVICYNVYTSPVLAWDLMAAKLEGVRFVIENHQVFSGHMIYGEKIADFAKIYKYSDEMIVLSELDVLFWRMLGVKARYIPNPLPKQIGTMKDKNRKKVVWVGRLNAVQKQFMDVIHIMRDVIRIDPEVQLFVYGEGETVKEAEQLKAAIKKEGLENNIIYKGYEKDIEKIYDGVGIHLLTSSYESFGMVILESEFYGIPLVTYEMPYLELLKNKKGYISVKQGDLAAAANAIISLVKDEDLWARLSGEALCNYGTYTNEDVAHAWQQMLYGKPSKEVIVNKDYQIILKTIVFHYEMGRKQIDIQNDTMRELENVNRALQVKIRYIQEQKKVVLYPFGIIGRKLLKALEIENVPIAFVLDQSAISGIGVKRLKISDLEKIDCSKYLFVLCSDRRDIHRELMTNLKKYVTDCDILDLFPENMDGRN